MLFVLVDGWNVLVGLARPELPVRGGTQMGIETVIGIGRSALEMTLVLAAPGAAVRAGGRPRSSASSRRMTQINEMTLTFIPKIAGDRRWRSSIFGPWMLTRLVNYTTALFQSLPDYVR